MKEIMHKLGCNNKNCLSFENCLRAQGNGFYRFRKLEKQSQTMCKLFIPNVEPNLDFLNANKIE